MVTSDPVAILYVIDTLEIGGTEQSLLHLCRHLDRARFRPLICRLYAGSALDPEFNLAGVRVISANVGGKYGFAAGFLRLRRLARREQPALVHTMLFRANQVGRAVGRWLRLPVISSLVNVPYDPVRIAIDPTASARKLGMLRRVDALTARWVTRFHAVSAAVRDSNCRHLRIDPERVSVIPRGREIGDAPRDRAAVASRLRQELQLPPDAPVVLNVGRLIAQKGQRTLIEALPQVLAQFPAARLLIAGAGPLRAELQSLVDARNLGTQVRLLGSRTDLPELLCLADCFAFPSLYEGLPGAVLEAMLAQCPVVASDIPMLDGIIASEASGLLVPPGDPALLGAAILRVLGQREWARSLAARAYTHARAHFDIRTVTRQIEGLYEQVLREAGR
jgi:glycosyltransferase involved in cell wall biosynthesis